MARSRAFHQKFFTSEHCLRLSFFDRLFFLGIIAIANDYGKLRSHPSYLKSAIFPYDSDVNLQAIERGLESLENEKMVMGYEAEGSHWCKVVNWEKYQNPCHPGKDDIPNPSQEILESFEKRSRIIRATLCPGVVVGVVVGGEGGVVEKTPPTPLDPPYLVFKTNGKTKQWSLSQKRFLELKDLYPAANVEFELKKAQDWCERETIKRKTANGMERFLSTWLTKAHNNSRVNGVEKKREEVIR